MNLAAVKRVRLEEVGGRGAQTTLSLPVFPQEGCAHRKFPGDPSVSKAIPERCILFSYHCIRMTLLEVTLDDGEDTRMS